MHTRTWVAMGSVTLMALAFAGCGPEKVAPPSAPVAAVTQTEKPGQVIDRAIVSVAARVVKVDQKARVVTLKNAEGKVFDLQVGEEVRNLSQVKRGDDVVVTYYESLAFTLKKAGEAKPGVTVADAAGRAEPGEKPGAAVGRQTTIVATVVGLDKKKGTVKLKGPQGKVVEVQARDPKRLEPVKVGDLIEAVYSEAMAISVEKPEKP
ncbi:MAG: hypothetical protein IT294_07960 [Deltaproteobacteria bacterium]|nr:hypothetical protein [Deltaproteobacteria bacterium]